MKKVLSSLTVIAVMFIVLFGCGSGDGGGGQSPVAPIETVKISFDGEIISIEFSPLAGSNAIKLISDKDGDLMDLAVGMVVSLHVRDLSDLNPPTDTDVADTASLKNGRLTFLFYSPGEYFLGRYWGSYVHTDGQLYWLEIPSIEQGNKYERPDCNGNPGVEILISAFEAETVPVDTSCCDPVVTTISDTTTTTTTTIFTTTTTIPPIDIIGCKDISATNYDPLATVDSGLCTNDAIATVSEDENQITFSLKPQCVNKDGIPLSIVEGMEINLYSSGINGITSTTTVNNGVLKFIYNNPGDADGERKRHWGTYVNEQSEQYWLCIPQPEVNQYFYESCNGDDGFEMIYFTNKVTPVSPDAVCMD